MILIYSAHAQQAKFDILKYSNLKTRTIPNVGNIEYQIDNAAIIPGSVSIDSVSKEDYKINYQKGILTFLKPMKNFKFFIVHYRIYPFDGNKKYQLVDNNDIKNQLVISKTQNDFYGEKSLENIIDMGGLKYSGSFGRGVSFGNNQDLVMNSNLNLQFSGYLADSILVSAAISDNNLPFQPEGNTQQIQDFDQIYIQLKKSKHNLVVGDHEIFKPEGYFLNYYKRLQGINYSNAFNQNKNIKFSYNAGLSVAKGKLARNILDPKDGNQGPYRLNSNDGNLFFIILANSERVYVDNQLMNRGENKDYIMDYNSGTITFKPNRMINKDLRIIVEFEYINREYVNSIATSSVSMEYKNKLKTYINLYSNQDSPNQPLNTELSDSTKLALSLIGDNLQLATLPNFKQVEYESGKIFYNLVDTLYQNKIYQVFREVFDTSLKIYQVGFSYLGEGKGDYKISNSNNNNRIYIWIPPINGKSQGDFSPEIIINTPKKQQMITGGIQYKINERFKVNTEIAYSNYDPNRFSRLQDSTHHGWAWSLDIIGNNVLNLKSKNNLSFNSHFEVLNKAFTPIVRYRNPEFERDWAQKNTSEYSNSNEVLSFIKMDYNIYNKGNISFISSFFKSDTIFNAMKNELNFNVKLKSIEVVSANSILDGSQQSLNVNYIRTNTLITKQLNKKQGFSCYTKYNQEKNTKQNTVNDSLNFESFFFKIMEAGLEKNNPKGKWSGLLKWYRRDNFLPDSGQFKLKDFSNNFEINSKLSILKNQTISIISTYRSLNTFIDSILNNQPIQTSTYISRLQYNSDIKKGFITQVLFYEIGTGQEQKRNYSYLEVASGQGQYYWIDYNQDGIKQLNEFELALYQDQARFIKIFNPTNQFVNAQFVKINYTLNFVPLNLIGIAPKNRFIKVVGKIQAQVSIQIENKLLNQGINQILYSPFPSQNADSVLIFSNQNQNIAVFYNQRNSTFGVNLRSNNYLNKALNTYGLESRNNKNKILEIRYNLNRMISTLHTFTYSEISSNTPVIGFENRNFDIQKYAYQPIVNLIYKTDWRLQFIAKYTDQKNTMGIEHALIKGLEMNTKWNASQKGTIEAKVEYNKIVYNANPNTTLGYTMLNGLTQGHNFVWKLNFSKRILKNVESILEYEGRKLGNSEKVIQIGRMTIRAIF